MQRDYTANCAVCGGPGEPECPCEGTRLQQCINQAETKWIESWISKTRYILPQSSCVFPANGANSEWVMNNAINTVTTMFERKKEARKEMFKQQVLNIPYFPMYQQHRGRPPLDPRIIINIQGQLHAAEVRLKQGIDQDWKACVIRYPEVLAHYYNQVQMQIPAQAQPPFGQALAGGGQPRPPSVVNLPPPPQSMVGMSVPRSATAPPKKNPRERRSSKVNLDPSGLDGDVMALLTGKLEGIQGLGRSGTTGRTKAATPAPMSSTPAPMRSGRPVNKRRESKDYNSAFRPPPPPQVPQPPGYDHRNSFLGSLGSLGQLGQLGH